MNKPFFFEQVEEKSFSSILTEGRLHFIRQKKDRRAPEQSLEGPGVMSVFTGSPAERAEQGAVTLTPTITFLYCVLYTSHLNKHGQENNMSFCPNMTLQCHIRKAALNKRSCGNAKGH